jgi:hypothetical protein
MKTQDSTLAFYINQLDAFDPTLHQPLTNVTWSRDIDLRTDVSMANESASFTRQGFASTGTLSTGSNTAGASQGGGKPWLNPNSNTMPAVAVDSERVVQPIRLLGQEITYTSVDLERSQLTGAPIDTQKLQALNVMYQMFIDEQVYVGDAAVGAKGLINNGNVTVGTAYSNAWSSAGGGADVVLSDVNASLNTAWAASGYAVCPDSLLLPPSVYAYLTGAKVSSAGNMSILEYLKANSLATSVNGAPLRIAPLKWAANAGVGNATRSIYYSKAADKVRFPLVPIRRETAYYQSIRYTAPYIWGMGEVEVIYPETVLYRDAC